MLRRSSCNSKEPNGSVIKTSSLAMQDPRDNQNVPANTFYRNEFLGGSFQRSRFLELSALTFGWTVASAADSEGPPTARP